MASEFEIVDVWACRFPSQAAFEEYMRELPREDSDEPLSEFISDQCQEWYDHDFLGCHFHGEPSLDVERLLRDGHAFAASYAASAADAPRRLNLGPANATITMWGEEVRSPRSVHRNAYQVDYLGRFPCKPDEHPEWFKRILEGDFDGASAKPS
jgi:hypothetical protein